MEKLTQQTLKEKLKYDKNTWIFTWVNQVGSVQAWAKAWAKCNWYIRIKIQEKNHYAHRLAWLYEFWEMPELIDHKNLNRNDNRICNLRIASKSDNQRNRPLNKNSTTGLKGVKYSAGRFEAQCSVNWKWIHIWTYKTKEEAHMAYINYTKKVYWEFQRSA